MSASTSGGADGASPTEAFSLMLHALLISHVLGPRLAPSAFSNMIRGRQGGQGQGQGRSTSRSPETGRGAIASPDPGTASLPLSPLLTDAVLDAVWAVDVELESRRELSGGDLAFGKGKDGKVEMGTARKRLAEVVAEFVVSIEKVWCFLSCSER